MLALCGSLAPPVAAQPAPRQCYKLTKVDTSADDKAFLEYATVHQETDGSLTIHYKPEAYQETIVGTDPIWRVWVKDGKAVKTQGGTTATTEIHWTAPPAIWCTDGDPYQLSVSVDLQGDGKMAFGKGAGLIRYYSAGDGALAQVGDPTGYNPLRWVAAGSGDYGSWVPSASGSVKVRPKLGILANRQTEWVLTTNLLARASVRVNGGVDFNVNYHYVPIDPNGQTTTGSSTPPPPPPPPPPGCAKTFGKDWNTNFGRLTFTLNGSHASGMYANREGGHGKGTITGDINGNVLSGTWADNDGKGAISITLSDDGCHFNGTYNVSTGGGPGPSQPSTGTDTNYHPTTPLPTDVCGDPAAQQCIDKWLALATTVRNRRADAGFGPKGPWHINEYGLWFGPGFISAGKQDEWATKYHSSKYCYVWMEWQHEHEAPLYGGELPALKDFVSDCYSQMGGLGPGPGPGSGPGPNPPPPTSKMTLVAFKVKVAAGEAVSVPVWLYNGVDVANMNFTVTYDATIAKVEGAAMGGYQLDDALFTSNPKDVGLFRLGFARKSGIGGSGPVAYLPFRAVGKPGDKTPLTLAVTTINNTSGATPSIELIHGEILIVGPGGMLPGDCDGDGMLTEADAWCALQMSVNNIPAKPQMDMDQDGQVTSRDATLILQKTSTPVL